MLNRLPKYVGTFDEVCEDLGIAGQYRQIAAALGVHERTVRRWKNHGAPRTALLALWWLSREGYSMWDAEMHNRATLAMQYAAALARDGRLRLDGAGDPLGVLGGLEPANDRGRPAEIAPLAA
jgi:hypothetical protein